MCMCGVEKQLTKDIFEGDIDGNAFAILGAFAKQARQDGWSKEEIDAVIGRAKSGDYDNLVQTIMIHSQ